MITADLTFSLIINTTDRAESLRTLLRALEHQSYPHFEVIVVVGPTRDNTLSVLAEYQGRLHLLRCPQANLGQSRNIGLAAAGGDIVAYVDDDAVPCRRWLEQLAQLFQNPNLDATGGVVYLAHPNQPTIQHRIGIASSLAEQVDVRTSWLDSVLPSGNGVQWIGRMMGTNMAFRRDALLEIGGFDEFYEWVYDDTDVAIRLVNAGKIVHPVREAVMYHIPASSRNRVAFSYTGKWWVQTKAAVYFSIRHGIIAGDTFRSILLRCLHLVHGHWLWSGELWRQRRITMRHLVKMRFEEIRSALTGAAHALLRPRQLMDATTVTTSDTAKRLTPFQNSHSQTRPAVDPVSGRRYTLSMPEPPLRICLLSSAYPPQHFEGVGRHTNLMARGLFESGHTVHVIARGDREEVSFYDGAYVHRLPERTGYDRYRLFPKLYYSLNHSHAVHDKVKRLILNDGIQVVDSPLWQFDGLVTAVSQIAPVAVRLQTALRQIAAIQHDGDSDARLVGEMEQALLERACYWIPNSQATLDNVGKVYGIRPDENRYTIIPHGIVPVPDDAVRPLDLSKVPETFTVLYLGRLEKRKGIQDFFQAIPRVLKQVANIHFIVAGADNSHRDGFQEQTGMDYATYFSRRYHKYTPCVTFTGQVSEEKLNELYESCDLFVAPSLYESFGLIYLEAMNYAKPVIGCRAGGIPEVVDDGVTGLLVEPEAAASLAEAIVTCLQSPIKLYEMGVAGRQRLLQNFTYLQMARNFERVYRHMITHQATITGH